MEQLSTAVQPVNTWHSARSRRTAATSRAACAGHPWGVQGPSSAVLNFTYVASGIGRSCLKPGGGDLSQSR